MNAAIPRDRLVPVVELYVRESGLPGRRDRDPRYLRRRVDKIRQGKQPRFTRGFVDRLLVDMNMPEAWSVYDLDVAA